MSIISISRTPYTSSEAIARNVAGKLGYVCLDQEVFEEATAGSGIPPDKLQKAFSEPPSLFGMSLTTRKRCVASVQAGLSARYLDDDVVYLGDFGHLLVHGVSHLLKVRITAQEQDRVAQKAEREDCTTKEAEKQIQKSDKQRAALAKQLFGVEGNDSELFDLVINTSQVDIDTATDIIVDTVKHKRYQPMTYSVRCMQNVELGHRVRAALIDLDPDVDVQAEDGKVRVRIRDAGDGKGKRSEEIEQRAASLAGVEQVEVLAVKDLFDGTSRRGR